MWYNIIEDKERSMQLNSTPTKTRRPSWRTIANLYREGLTQVFGCGDDELDADLLKALTKDVHHGPEAPGQWSAHSILEIYCEGGIPNATDINDFSCYASETGCDPSELVSYNSDRWYKVDQYVNQTLGLMGYPHRVYNEPYNGGVVNVHWS